MPIDLDKRDDFRVFFDNGCMLQIRTDSLVHGRTIQVDRFDRDFENALRWGKGTTIDLALGNLLGIDTYPLLGDRSPTAEQVANHLSTWQTISFVVYYHPGHRSFTVTKRLNAAFHPRTMPELFSSWHFQEALIWIGTGFGTGICD